jgi:hypothetical protein
MNKTASQESLLVLGAIGVVGTAVAKALIEKIGKDAAGEVIKNTKAVLKSSQQTDLVRVTQSARVEPILLMDQRATTVPFIQDVVHSLFNLFTGYWLLAVSLETTINGVSVGRRLDKFATDRDLADATSAYMDNTLSANMDSMDIGLPFSKTILQANFEQYQSDLQAEYDAFAASLEALSDADRQKIEDTVEGEQYKKHVTQQATGAAGASRVVDPGKAVQTITNLAVGNMVEVVISEDGKEARVPVMIRLRVAGMNPKALVQTLAVGGVDMSFRGRWRAWRAGELRFWSDFVMAMDRVDAHRAASMNDETGYYKTVYNRAKRNSLAEILTQGPSLGTASSIIVLTQASADELEREIGGQLSSFKVRQGIFGHTYSMLMAVVDPDWETVTIYTRGIEMATKLSKNDMKAAGKSDSKELMDILKSYQLGRAPGRI